MTMLAIGKGGKEAREENNRFKPTGRSLKQATLMLVWERKLFREEKVGSVIKKLRMKVREGWAG